MANRGKKISELTALTSASLDTTLVGVDNGTTYKIELDTLADAVTSRINTLDTQRLNSLESVTSSFETIGRDIISSSTQISNLGFVSGNYETTGRNILSGSVSYTNLTDIPQGIISESIDLTSLNEFTASQYINNLYFAVTGSNTFIGNQTLSGSIFISQSQKIQLGDLQFTSVYKGTIIETNTQGNSSFNMYGSQSADFHVGVVAEDFSYAHDYYIQPTSSSIVFNTLDNTLNYVPFMKIGNGTDDKPSFTKGIEITGSTILNTLTASLQEGYVWVGDSTGKTTLITTSSFIETLPTGIITSSSQLTSSFDERYTLSGSVQPLPSGLISGSSQLTSSYDTRYTLSGSVVSGTTPAGTISGSAQISAFGFVSGSYTTTSSFNSFTASAQAVTTGSNSFNGTQTITGSLIVTTGSFVGSQILANTSSLYLTSGSNMYVQNNGLVEITGSLVISGSTNLNGGELIWKSSGMVAVGTFVTLDNLKCTVTASGNRGLSIAAVSTSFEADISGVYSVPGATGGGSTNNITYTTTASTSAFGWNFGAHGDTAIYQMRDKTNNRFYRITLMIGVSYISNFISIERLY